MSRSLGRTAAAYLAVSGFFITLALVYTGGLQGTGDTRSPLFITLASQVAIPIGLCIVIQPIRPLQSTDIWLAIVLGHFARCVLSVTALPAGQVATHQGGDRGRTRVTRSSRRRDGLSAALRRSEIRYLHSVTLRPWLVRAQNQSDVLILLWRAASSAAAERSQSDLRAGLAGARRDQGAAGRDGRASGSRFRWSSAAARVRTGKTAQAVMPHKHAHVLADWHKAGAEGSARRRFEAAAEARRDWANWPWEDRAAVFLRAAELLTTTWRQTLNAATMLGQSKTVFQAEIDAASRADRLLALQRRVRAGALSTSSRSARTAPGTSPTIAASRASSTR